MPPHGADSSVEAAVEYTSRALGDKDIIACGHSHFGTMKGVLHPGQLADLPTVTPWLRCADTTPRLMHGDWNQHGWAYLFETGDVRTYSPAENQFIDVEEEQLPSTRPLRSTWACPPDPAGSWAGPGGARPGCPAGDRALEY